MLELVQYKKRLKIQINRFLNDKPLVFEFTIPKYKDMLELEFYLTKELSDEWLFEWLKERAVTKFNKRLFNKISNKQKVQIMRQITSLYKVNEKKTINTFLEKNGYELPAISNLIYLGQQTGYKVHELLDMTLDELKLLSEGVEWLNNEQTDKGKEENRKKYFRKNDKIGLNTKTAEYKKQRVEKDIINFLKNA